MRARVLIPFLLVSNAAVGGAVVTMRGERAAASVPAAPAPTDDDFKPDRHFPLQFVVRLQSGDRDHFVRTAFDLLLLRADDRDVVLANLPRIRDAVLAFYLDRKLDELTGSAGIERSKRAVLQRVQRVTGRPLRAVYLTDFVMM